jgi:hypothetical protein
MDRHFDYVFIRYIIHITDSEKVKQEEDYEDDDEKEEEEVECEFTCC